MPTRRRRSVWRAPAGRLQGWLLAIALCAGACGGQALPAGFHLHRNAGLGFQVGLAPGWSEVGGEPEGVDFADAGRARTLLVHVEPATSTDERTEAGALVSRLAALDRSQARPATLAGLPALRLSAESGAGGVAVAVEAAVVLQGSRAWVLLLSGPPGGGALFDAMAATFSLLPRRPAPGAHVAVGMPAPGFSELDAIHGPVVLNFFATWCGPCQAEMPMLSREASGAGGRYMVLAVDTHDDPVQVAAFAHRLGLDFPIAYDADGRIGQAYRLPGLPSTFFLDAHHTVRASVLGPLTPGSVAAGLRSAGA